MVGKNGKEIHIVFQVLNFIHSQYSPNLTNQEKLLLINLASHKGIKGMCPGVLTLSKELKKNERSVYRIIKSLEQKNLLTVQRLDGKANTYLFNFLSTPDNIVTPDRTITPDKLVSEPLTNLSLTPDKLVAIITNEITNEITNIPPAAKKTILTRAKKEQEQKNTVKEKNKCKSFLTSDFWPDRTGIELCQSLNLDMKFQLDQFMDYWQAQGKSMANWQAMFRVSVRQNSQRGQPSSGVSQKRQEGGFASVTTQSTSYDPVRALEFDRKNRERNKEQSKADLERLYSGKPFDPSSDIKNLNKIAPGASNSVLELENSNVKSITAIIAEVFPETDKKMGNGKHHPEHGKEALEKMRLKLLKEGLIQ
jgi:hypothetical protein